MIVDFQNSFISWETKNGSFGRFNSEAFLRYSNNDWLLGSEVMACNVYGNNKLVKEPNYSFEPLFSDHVCKIFRTYTLNGLTDDTVFQSQEQFKNHELHISEIENYTEVSLTDVLENLKPCQCIITTKEYQLQFPAKHLNVNRESKQFQIETGPVAIPNRETINTAFIAFNKLNEFEMLIYKNIDGKRNTKSITQKNCEIKIVVAL